MVNQVRLKNIRTKPVYKYGFQVPRNHAEAVRIDKIHGNTKWIDAEKLEIKQLMDYESFKELGKNAAVPEGYMKIPVHFVYDVKHDGRHKARLVAGGHRTSDINTNRLCVLRCGVSHGRANGHPTGGIE